MKCFICGDPNHVKRNCPKKSKSKNNNNNNGYRKDLSHIICTICKKNGHYATTCPDRTRKGVKSNFSKSSDKSVTFESAHIVQESDEHCRAVSMENSFGDVIPNLELYLQQCEDLNFANIEQELMSQDSTHDSMPELFKRGIDYDSDEYSSSDNNSMPTLEDGQESSCDSSSGSVNSLPSLQDGENSSCDSSYDSYQDDFYVHDCSENDSD
jgi:hypothetical protein